MHYLVKAIVYTSSLTTNLQKKTHFLLSHINGAATSNMVTTGSTWISLDVFKNSFGCCCYFTNSIQGTLVQALHYDKYARD